MTAIVWGTPTDSSTALVIAALVRRDADVVVMDVRSAERQRVALEVGGHHAGGYDGWIECDGRRVRFDVVSGVYVRPTEPHLVPGLAELEPHSPERQHASVVHDGMTALTELLGRDRPGHVLNVLSAMGSTSSKPHLAQAIVANGFSTPDTLVTDDPDEALAFAARHAGRCTISPISGMGSISGSSSVATPFDPAANRGCLERLRFCPMQFQERIDGPDVRVHVVGHRVFAAQLSPVELDDDEVERCVRLTVDLDDDVAERCVRLAVDLGLHVAGIDLKLASDSRLVCLGVDPTPNFSSFEQMTGLPIAAAIAQQLVDGPANRSSASRASHSGSPVGARA